MTEPLSDTDIKNIKEIKQRVFVERNIFFCLARLDFNSKIAFNDPKVASTSLPHFTRNFKYFHVAVRVYYSNIIRSFYSLEKNNETKKKLVVEFGKLPKIFLLDIFSKKVGSLHSFHSNPAELLKSQFEVREVMITHIKL